MTYKVPVTSSNEFGVVKAGSGIQVLDGVISTTLSPSTNYGFFYSTNTQNNPIPNTANTVSFNTVGTSSDVTVVANTAITVVNSGVYSKQFTLSIEKTTGGAPATVSIWLRHNGVNVPNSTQSINVPNQTALLFVSGGFVIDLLAGDDVQLMWSSSDTSIKLNSLTAQTGPARPATPSAKVSLIRIS